MLNEGIVLIFEKGGVGLLFGILIHGPELIDLEEMAPLAHADLAEKDGAGGIQLDGNGHKGKEKGKENQRHKRAENIRRAFKKWIIEPFAKRALFLIFQLFKFPAGCVVENAAVF